MPTTLEPNKTSFAQDGAAILVPNLGAIFTLNVTGAFIWSGLQRGEPPEVIASQLAAESGQSIEIVESDVRAFIESLKAQALVHVEGSHP